MVESRYCIESRDILDSVKIVVKRIQVAEPLGLHIRDNAGIDEGERFVLAKEGLPCREASVVSESMWKRAFSSIRSRRSTAASWPAWVQRSCAAVEIHNSIG